MCLVTKVDQKFVFCTPLAVCCAKKYKQLQLRSLHFFAGVVVRGDGQHVRHRRAPQCFLVRRRHRASFAPDGEHGPKCAGLATLKTIDICCHLLAISCQGVWLLCPNILANGACISGLWVRRASSLLNTLHACACWSTESMQMQYVCP